MIFVSRGHKKLKRFSLIFASLLYRIDPMIPNKHLYELFEKNVSHFPEKEAFFYKKEGSYCSITNREMAMRVSKLSIYLQETLKLSKGDRIALMSENSPHWVTSDLAILHFSGVVVPIYPTLTAEEVEYILTDSKTSCLILQTRAMVEANKHLLEICESLESIISIESFEITHPSIHFLDDILEKKSTEIRPHIAGSPEDTASIVYTSGTTGSPKGVCLSHLNFLSNISDICQSLPLDESLRVLSFLPLSHAFERTAGYYTVLAVGGTIYYAESMLTVANDLILAKPTAVVSVPRLYEKIYAKVMLGSPLKRALVMQASKAGSILFRKSKDSYSWLDTFRFKLFSLLVYNKFKRLTGGELKFFVSGGAPLGKELGEFFFSVGLLIIEGYGMTETSPVICCNRLESFKFGSVGLPMPSLETKLSDDGELCVKGPSVMTHYFQNEEKTNEILSDDGWLHTGDIATIDEDGFISIVDRKKDILILSNGKNIPPQPIETELLTSPLICQVIVLGDKKNFVSALIVPDKLAVKAHAEKLGVTVDDIDLFVCSDTVKSWVMSEISRLQEDDANYMRVKEIVLLPNELTQESGELTPTLKPKRKVIGEKYRSQIESIYTVKKETA